MELYTTAQVAENTGQSPRTIRQLALWHAIGRLMGRRRFFEKTDIERLRAIKRGRGRPKKAT